MATSRIRHLVSSTQSDRRNSSADEKARAAKPNSLSKSGSDSRTDSSSSTTDSSGHWLAFAARGNTITRQCATLETASIVPWYHFCTGAITATSASCCIHSSLSPAGASSGLRQSLRLTWDSKRKCGSGTVIGCRPEPSVMSLDNGTTDGESDSHAIVLG